MLTKGRRERKKEETRRRILDISIALFERAGFDAVTMERIAEEADVAKATLYSYFPAKESILVGWMQLTTTGLEERVAALLHHHPHTRQRIQALLELLGELIKERRALVEHYLLFRLSTKERFCGDPALRSGIAKLLRDLLAQGQTRGEVRRDLSPEELTTHLESLFLSTLMVWFVAGDAVDLGEQLEKMVTLFFEGAGGRDEL